MRWLLLSTALVLTIFGQLVLKKFSSERRIIFLIASLVIFITATVCIYGAMKLGLSVAQVYVATALIPAMMVLVGKYYFAEVVGLHHAIGVVLIFLGVVIFNL